MNNSNNYPICNSNVFRSFKLGLVTCRGCGVVLSPTIWQPQANETMEEEYFGETYQYNDSFWVKRFEIWNNRKTLKRLEQAKPAGRRLLEIGVGSRSFMNLAQNEGFDVMGCDLSTLICKQINRIYDISLHNAPLAEMDGENRFDVIV